MKKRVLFVCLGNICRSPSAEAVFNHFIKKHGMEDLVSCDSAGILAYHAGKPADSRMQRHATKRGYRLTSVSRRFDAQADFARFDLVIGMDEANMADLKQLANSATDREKISRMTDYCSKPGYTEVPDPYYGGAAGFELVLDLLEDACEGLLLKLKENK